jgi:signal peptidase II
MFYLVTVAVALADQLTKWLVVHKVHDRPILGDLLRLTLTENTGAAFGLFPGARASFILISLVAAVGLVYAQRLLRPRDARRPFLALVLGGNLGNLVDRVRLGHVVDFIDMGIGTARWPVYNLADIAVVAGAVGLGIWILADGASARRRLAVPPVTAEVEPAPASEDRSADAR